MNLRVTIGFLAVAVILGVLVFGLDKFNIGPTSAAQANATATTTASQQPQIFSFDDSKVTAFELHQADKSVQIQKQGDTWVVAGTGDPANKSSFTSLIVRMSQLKATRAVDNPGTDLSQYGLDSPKDTASATLDDGTKYELDIGNKTPTSCFMIDQYKNGKFVRVYPTKVGTFDCNKSNVYTFKQDLNSK